jgi:acyl dehydratase
MVTFRHEVSNQKGDIVLQTENPAMVRMRHPEKG